MTVHRVPDGVQATLLARYLSRAWPSMPGHVIRDALKRRDIRVNGVRSGPDATVRAGDELKLYIDDRFLAAAVSVLFTDGKLLVLDKPAGLPVDVDGAGIGADTLLARARTHYPSAQLCHRLDVGTGGVMLCSLTAELHDLLLSAFRAHQIEKYYRALVLGCPKPESAVLQAYLRKDADRAKVRVVDHPSPGAAFIETRYQVVRRGAELSELDIELVTGRTHQIRAHMAHIGCPLIGDDKYGNRAANQRFGAKTPQLWCRELRLRAGGLLAKYDGMALLSLPRFTITDR